MGWAFPAALGAKLAMPESPVVAFVGDGDFMMTMQELSTMAQYGIPVVVLVANNAGWLAIKDLQADVLGVDAQFGNDFRSADGSLYTPDFASIAEGFGITAHRASTADEVATALREAIASGRPALVEVGVCRDHPDSGGESFGWWDVPIPAYLTDQRAAYAAQITEEF
jgi:acetolactate synthase-1/2/3 large subunit